MPLTTESERAERFVLLLLSAHGHTAQFEFDLMSYPYEWVKLALEQAGYSVHRRGDGKVLANRVRPDLCPVAPDEANTTENCLEIR